MMAPRRRRATWRGPALIGAGQLLVALVVLGVGVYYDLVQRSPGLLTIAGLTLLGGPSVAVALRLARAEVPLAMVAAERDERPDDDRARRRRA